MASSPRKTLTVVRVLLPPAEHRGSSTETYITVSCTPDMEAGAFHKAVLDKLNSIRKPGVSEALTSDFYLTEKRGMEKSDFFRLEAPEFFQALSELAKKDGTSELAKKDGTNIAILYLVMVGEADICTIHPTRDALQMGQPQQGKFHQVQEATVGEPTGSRTWTHRVHSKQVDAIFKSISKGLEWQLYLLLIS